MAQQIHIPASVAARGHRRVTVLRLRHNGGRRFAGRPSASLMVDTRLTGGTGSNNNQFVLPLDVAGTYNFEVFWGDGSSDTITAYNDAAATHTYANAGIYNVILIGTIQGFRFNDGGDKLKLLEVKQHHNLFTHANLSAGFRGCANMTRCSGSYMAGSTNLNGIFRECSSLVSFPNLDFSNCTSATTAMRECTTVTTVPLWDLSSLTSASGMFNGCTSLTTFPEGFGLTLGACADFSNFLGGGVTLTTESYSQFLIELESVNSNNAVSLNGGNSTYNAAGAVARQALIDDHSWTITDGGAA